MNAKERVLAAFEHRMTDRPPIYPVITYVSLVKLLGKTLSDAWTDPELAYEALYKGWETFGFDGFEVPAVRNEKIPTKMEDGILYILDSEGEKISYFPTPDDFPVDLKPAKVYEYEEILKMHIPTCEELLESGQFDLARKLVERIGGRAFLSGHASDQTFNALVSHRGANNALMDAIEEPELVHQAHELFTKKSIEKAKAYASIGMDAIYIGDAWSSASVISPAMFKEFCVPYYRMAVKEIHKLGLKVYLHICGNSAPILEHMASTGVDGIEPLDPLGGVSLSDARDRVGKVVALKGGINTLTLLNGTPEEVEAETRQCLELFRGVPGYIFGTGDDIPRDVSVENMKRMCETVRAFQNG